MHTFIGDVFRHVGTFLYGRRMYETMVFWETAHTDPDAPPHVEQYNRDWQAAEEVVHSTTLESVSSERTRIERTFDADAVRRLKAGSDHDLSVDGPHLAAQAIAAGLVDEYHLFITTSVVGGGTRFFPDGVRLDLDRGRHRRRATMADVSTDPARTVPEPVVLRPSGVRLLAATTWILLLVFLVLTTLEDTVAALRFAPAAALVALVVYALFWRPRIDVDADGVTLANVVRDTRVPFARLEDVRTRFALSLETVEGTFTSWSSPAPGRTSAMSISRRDTKGFAAMGQPSDQGVSASAAPNTDSGAAALLVRHRWEVWREHGGSPDPVALDRITRTWDVPLICAFAVLLALSALAAVL